jgi:hypothetical protein
MARVKIIKLNIDGKELSYNVNVAKDGIFRCHLHYHTAEKLGIENGKLEYDVLSDLEDVINAAYHKYLESSKSYEVYIGIEYKADRKFKEDSEGRYLFDSSSIHQAKTSFNDNIGSCIVFGFKFYVKESISTGQVLWYESRKVDPEYELNTFEKRHGNFVFTNSTFSTSGVLVPYTEAAEQTLKKGAEGLRNISELLYKFISQDKAALIESLSSGKLLNQ